MIVTNEESGSELSDVPEDFEHQDEDEDFVLEEEEMEEEDLDLDEFPLDECEAAPEEPDFNDDEEEEEELENESPKTESSNQPRKKVRISIEPAEQWIHAYNQANPVDDDDPDLLRFQANMRSLVGQMCIWAREDNGSMSAWFKLPASDREMTTQFRSLLARISAQELIENIFVHMPRKVQKLFGKQDLTPIDLLDLPLVPHAFAHRLTYMDIPVRVGVDKITRVQGVKGGTVKVLKPDARLEGEEEVKAYVGAAISKLGGYTRIRGHEDGANGKGEKCMHYDFSQQADVVPNLRIVGVWSNPHVVDSLNADNDTQKWLPIFLEGVIMLYLGLVHRQDTPLVDRSHAGVFAEAKYAFIDNLRNGLDLPDFHSHTLNKAWSLAQGVRGGMITVNECSNPLCKRPKWFHGKEEKFLPTTGPLSERVCLPCWNSLKKKGQLRTSNRTNYRKSDGARVCNNPNCRVTYDESKGNWSHDLLDPSKWRCAACASWQYRHNGEDRPSEILRAGDGRACCNPNCDKEQVPDGPSITWRSRTSDTGVKEWRCRACDAYIRDHPGIERPPTEQLRVQAALARAPPITVPVDRACCNCGKVQDPNEKRIPWHKNHEEPGKYRCCGCGTYWDKNHAERPERLYTRTAAQSYSFVLYEPQQTQSDEGQVSTALQPPTAVRSYRFIPYEP